MLQQIERRFWNLVVSAPSIGSWGPGFESCRRWNWAYNCMVLHCTEPFVITFPLSLCDSNNHNDERDIKHQIIIIIINNSTSAYLSVPWFARMKQLSQGWQNLQLDLCDADQPAHPLSHIRDFSDCLCLLQPLGYPKRDKREPYYTGWMHRVIFAGHTGLVVGFILHWLTLFWYNKKKKKKKKIALKQNI